MGLKNLFRNTDFAPALLADPIAFYDIGARGGFDQDLWPIAFGVDAVGFEPDPEEYERLNRKVSGAWHSSKILPVAIGDEIGNGTLHIPAEPEGASLLAPLENLPEHLNKKQYSEIKQTVDVDTVTLDHVFSEFDLTPPDYLKIDIEGIELRVFHSSPRMMDNLLAVKVEVFFVHLRDAQGISSEIETFMREAGFSLMDIISPAHWRRDGYVIHPHLSEETIPYSRGQLVQGDYLFFRDPNAEINRTKLSAAQNLKLAFIAMSFGFFDFASEILAKSDVAAQLAKAGCLAPQDTLAACSRRYGRIVTRREFGHHIRLLGPYLRRFRDLILR